MANLEQQSRTAQEFILNIGKGGVAPARYADDLTAWSLLSGMMDKTLYLSKLDTVRQIFTPPLEITVDTVTAQVGRVAIQARSTGVLFNGTHYSNDYMFLVEFDSDDRITHVREYFDSTRAIQALVPAMREWNARQAASPA